MATWKPIPIIDLFAGPGGLGEGFSSIQRDDGTPFFSLKVSIEKDVVAHQTLSLRSLFRKFPRGKVPDCYYDHIRGDISRAELFAHPAAAEAGQEALKEARNLELGKDSPEEIDQLITSGLAGETDWLLIGGPPCQAYSLAGRARRTRESIEKFESDEKHFLYREYLRIIRRHKPAVFIMENVKGMLSSTHGGSRIFDRIVADLTSPGDGLHYEIRSLVTPGIVSEIDPHDTVIEAERYGVPQGRHRVILFGIRADVALAVPALSETPEKFTLQWKNDPIFVEEALSGLPRLRSRLSKEPDSHEDWISVLHSIQTRLDRWQHPRGAEIIQKMREAAETAQDINATGGAFIASDTQKNELCSRLSRWLIDDRLGGVIQHEARSHMRSDIHRYLFASSYAAVCQSSPKVNDFPPLLWPNHGNVYSIHVPFTDRFRVQRKGAWSSTVVAHIAKDGHYFIHYDPAQCRSLTVREAARLQTFPDNYFFSGNRTQQYTQVGNAVPPWLARRIASVVKDFMSTYRDHRSHR